jgi:lipoprotein-anchoring transpeptidase ErfK/SrfK
LLRILAPSLAVTALALPATAVAQVPTPPGGQQPPAPTPTPPPKPAKANLAIELKSGVRKAKKIYTVRRELVVVRGKINKAAAGETVQVELWRKKREVAHRNARVRGNGRFRTKLRPRGAGMFRIRATHKKSDKVAKDKTKAIWFRSIKARAGRGKSGPRVELLQRQLAKLGYAVPRSGTFDDGTARAVLAYRKVNRMSRTTVANRTIFRRLFQERGAFKLRHPNAGKHVEADLSRQVLVLADGGKPVKTYHTSSGAPATPTVTGSYRFYRQDPGYNAVEMYYSSYFIRGYAIHGYKSVPTYNASHGCLRVPLSNAISIYNWIDLGDRIYVYA